MFVEAPSGLLSKVSKIVETQRALTVGVNEDGVVIEVSITSRDKYIFYFGEDDTSEILFPELQHGQRVRLDGVVTHGNESANTIGFQYSGHILTCHPRRGSIVRFKRQLFLRCWIIGEISRLDDRGGASNPRPQIIFDDLQIIYEDGSQPLL